MHENTGEKKKEVNADVTAKQILKPDGKHIGSTIFSEGNWVFM